MERIGSKDSLYDSYSWFNKVFLTSPRLSFELFLKPNKGKCILKKRVTVKEWMTGPFIS